MSSLRSLRAALLVAAVVACSELFDNAIEDFEAINSTDTTTKATTRVVTPCDRARSTSRVPRVGGLRGSEAPAPAPFTIKDAESDNSTDATEATTATTTFITRGIPVSSCQWIVQPTLLHAWDPRCLDLDIADEISGCKADGKHKECRFCGHEPFAPCPTCEFKDKPVTPYVWDSRCKPGIYVKGCFADGIHFECRFCGASVFDACSTTDAIVTTTVATTSSPDPTTTSTVNVTDRSNSSSSPRFGHHLDRLLPTENITSSSCSRGQSLPVVLVVLATTVASVFWQRGDQRCPL